MPEGFHVPPELARQLERRRETLGDERRAIDWALPRRSPSRAFSSRGTPVRLSGQDSERGTFNQRHAVLVDQTTGDEFAPLDHLRRRQPRFEVYDSRSPRLRCSASSTASPGGPPTLVLWEAQFGDFANGAQMVIDQFLAARLEVGADLAAHAAPAPRLRGPRPGALERPRGALPPALRAGQPPDRELLRRPRSTSTSCAGRRTAASAPARRLHAEEPAAGPSRPPRARRAASGWLPRRARRRGVTDEHARRGSCSLGQGLLRPVGAGRPRAGAGRRRRRLDQLYPSPCPLAEALRAHPRRGGRRCRKSRRTWGRSAPSATARGVAAGGNPARLRGPAVARIDERGLPHGPRGRAGSPGPGRSRPDLISDSPQRRPQGRRRAPGTWKTR